MANNTISLWGATYSNVGACKLPKQGGGQATFTDVSDTTAAAGDVASGKYFYTSAGMRTAGTASGGGGVNIQVNSGSASVHTNGYTSTGLSLTVSKAGTYKVSWAAWRSSSQGTMGTRLRVNSTDGTAQQTWTNTYGQHIQLTNQSYSAGDVLTLYATSGSTSRYCWVANLIIEQTA